MLSWIKTHRFLSSSVIVVILFGLFFYSRRTQDTYQEFRVSRGSIQETLELSGKVYAERQATLRFATGGLVTYLGAREGEIVNQWQTLASLDTRQLNKTLEQKLNLYKSQLNTFDDTKDTYKNEIEAHDIDNTLRRILERNQFSLENSVKDVEYLDLSIKLSRLTSPIKGILVHAPINTPNVTVLATDNWIVVDPLSLYFSADLDETDLKRVQIGQKVEITLDAYSQQTINSVVSSIAYTPKETSSATVYEVKLSLPSDQISNLRLGLNGVASIILTEKNDILLLPSSAITFEGIKTFVYLKDGSNYTLKEIETGIENNGFIEVLSGVSQDEQVYLKQTK